MLLVSSKISDFDKVDQDLQFLIQCFREVLEEDGESALAASLRFVITTAAPSTSTAIITAAAFTLNESSCVII